MCDSSDVRDGSDVRDSSDMRDGSDMLTCVTVMTGDSCDMCDSIICDIE